MRVRAKQGFAITIIAAGALVALAGPASAWTYQDCVEVNFNHPDCTQYQTTTTTEAPTSTSTTTVASSSTSSSVPTSTTPSTAPTTTSTPQTAPPVVESSTSSSSAPHGIVRIGTAATESPHTGKSSGPLIGAGLLALIVGALSLAYARRPKANA